jgi:hypothetical protein
MATTRPSRTYTAAPDAGLVDERPCPPSSGEAPAAIGAAGRTALRKTADTAAVVVRHMVEDFRLMIFTFRVRGSVPEHAATMLPRTGRVRLK